MLIITTDRVRQHPPQACRRGEVQAGRAPQASRFLHAQGLNHTRYYGVMNTACLGAAWCAFEGQEECRDFKESLQRNMAFQGVPIRLGAKESQEIFLLLSKEFHVNSIIYDIQRDCFHLAHDLFRPWPVPYRLSLLSVLASSSIRPPLHRPL